MDISNFKAELTSLAESLDTLKNKEKTLIVSSPLTLAQMEKWESQHQLLKQQIPSPPLKWLVVALVALALGGVGLMRFTSGRRQQKKTTAAPIASPPFLQRVISKDNVEKGIIFSGSPMLSGPLPIALAHCEEAYNAVGRIGRALQDVPTGDEDEPFGTGILIAPNKVLTNHHVLRDYDSIGHDPDIGIEFHWEKDSDRSEFIAFDTTIKPVILDGFDAAILTLKETSPNRVPISMTDQPAEDLSGRDVVIIGYPYTYWSQEAEVVSATQEDEPIMGVKRYSEAQIFDHAMGRQSPYGVQAPVSDYINPSKTMRAVCHNASTMGGSSDIAQIITDIIDPDVTRITDKKPEISDKNS